MTATTGCHTNAYLLVESPEQPGSVLSENLLCSPVTVVYYAYRTTAFAEISSIIKVVQIGSGFLVGRLIYHVPATAGMPFKRYSIELDIY